MAMPRSANIKLLLLIVAVAIGVSTLLYTRSLVGSLLEKERNVADLYVKAEEFVANHAADQAEYGFIFNEIIRPAIDFPMVLSDANDEPLSDYRLNVRNVDLDTTLSLAEQRAFLLNVIADLDRGHPPINVILRISPVDSIVQHLHYGESVLITRLRWLPYIELGVAAMFILLAYIGFSTIKRSEQSSIWVGMSKETAHQLGTPLSSMLGWMEMMKEQAAEHPKQLAILADMEHDIGRLQKVTDRFQKIGSKPSLREEDLHEVIESSVNYFRQRLPSRFAQGRSIEITIETEDHIRARINRELFEWVLENLIKNALDAMEEKAGSITFSLTTRHNAIFLDIHDTGKGIDPKVRKDIFRPGYSTKRRGWGLGLSLSKRIIESYHKGKLFIKETRVGKGTTFRIRLNKSA